MLTTLGRWFQRLCACHAGLAVALVVAAVLRWRVLDGQWNGMPALAWLWVVVPTVVAGLAVDLARWRVRVYQNRERQRIYRFLNEEMLDDKSRLLQKLLGLRRRLLETESADALIFDHLDQLIVDQHRHLSMLCDRATDSARMAPLLTGVYTGGLRETTWTASLEGEFEASRRSR